MWFGWILAVSVAMSGVLLSSTAPGSTFAMSTLSATVYLFIFRTRFVTVAFALCLSVAASFMKTFYVINWSV